jgi:outer membrane protein assembly factor BamB
VETAPFGQGPCAERGDILYLFDAGVLAAFDLAMGNARWRLPSVGVAGLFFDNKGMMYVNTTTASGESLKYSRQIDVSQKIRQVVLKLDAKTGKMLWQTEQQGMVNYVSGKFVYTTESYEGDEGGDGIGVKTGFEVPPHIRIKRLDPGNGRVLWEHYQRRAPLDVRFEANTIQLLFKQEMQLLKFIAL